MHNIAVKGSSVALQKPLKGPCLAGRRNLNRISEFLLDLADHP